MKNILAKIRNFFFPPKQFIFVEADYIIGKDSKVVFRVEVVKGRFGIVYLYNPCMFKLGQNGECINDMKETVGYGKPFPSVRWLKSYVGPYKEYDWQSALKSWR